MSAINHCPRHVPSLMALASLYKAKGMLEESAAVLRRALQSCEAASNSSSRNSTSSDATAADSSSSTAAAAVLRGAALGVGSSSSSSSGSAAAAAAAGGVSRVAVQEALAVVLTDLGTRAKNAGKMRLLKLLSPPLHRLEQLCGRHLLTLTKSVWLRGYCEHLPCLLPGWF